MLKNKFFFSLGVPFHDRRENFNHISKSFENASIKFVMI